MLKTLFAVILPVVLFLSFIPFQNVSSQSEDEETTWLRGDLRTADIVAYVEVKKIKYAGRSDDKADCENNKGAGYCSYLLTAEIKEIFKGKIETKMLEFHTGTEAAYPKKGLLGEQIVFLVWDEDDEGKTKSLIPIENSTRRMDVLERMRRIVNPQSPIDENNESEPYSLKALKKEFEEADAVIYADVKNLKKDTDEVSGSYPFVLNAEIKEVFKGSLKAGQKLAYKEDLLYRPLRNEDLGEQIIFLERKEEGGNISYKRFRYSVSDVRHNILEKLRQIAKEKLNGKN